jgi:hypothetical protein
LAPAQNPSIHGRVPGHSMWKILGHNIANSENFLRTLAELIFFLFFGGIKQQIKYENGLILYMAL